MPRPGPSIRAAWRRFNPRESPDFEALLFNREIHVTARILPWAAMTQAVVIVLFAIEGLPRGTAFPTVWVIIGLLLNGYMFFAWRSDARQAALPNPVRVRNQILLVTVLFAAYWCALCVDLFPAGDRDKSALLSAAIAGLLGGGAIAFSTSQLLALTWVLTFGFAAAITQLSQRNSTLRLQALHAAIYVAMLCVGVIYLQKSFRARCRAEYRADAERKKVELFLNEFEGGSRDWIWETHADGTLSHASARFAQVSGLAVDHLQTLTLRQVIEQLQVEDDEEPAYANLFDALSGGRDFYAHVVPLRVAGQRRWWLLSGRVEQVSGGWRGIGADITDMKLAQDRIDRMAKVDALTGLPNRHALNIELAARVAARSTVDALHFAILDLDNFKTVNDTLGHPLGDKLLVAIGQRIAGLVHGAEFCARLGGDEFAVIVDGALDDEAARARFQHFQTEVFRQPFTIDGTVLEITSSLGLTSSRVMDEIDADALIVAADLALYGAKDLGRNRVNVYSAQLRSRASARARSLRAIASGLANHEFEMLYQPQVGVFANSLLGFEALVRWRHPDGMVLPPSEFIELAEETGLIVQLGREIISMVCLEAATWPEELSVSVNISPRQLLSPGFPEALADGLTRSRLAPDRLIVEITESALVDPDARRNLEDARADGIRIALDDFGTGYSSLAQLVHMPVDEIKIDRTFVDRLRGRTESPTAVAVVASVVDLARALGVRTVAEGVETRSQLDRLASLGCDAYQGYLEAPPLPPAEIEDYLARRSERELEISEHVAGPAPLRLIPPPDAPDLDE